MKTAVCQPEYPRNYKKTLEVMKSMEEFILSCDLDTELIVLPEYSNCPGMSDLDKIMDHLGTHGEPFISTVRNAARKTRTAVCFNILAEEEGSLYNRTLFIDEKGRELLAYDKTHLAYPELFELGITEGNELRYLDYMGIRFCFAVCFELYFPSYFESIARFSPDVILSPSYQRSEESEILLKQAAGRALDTGSWIIRSSYSMGTGSKKGGTSYIVSPSGDVVVNAGQSVGIFTCDFNPLEKRMRPLAHGLQKMSSREIIDRFKRPELYRSSCPPSYPRICAHRGASGIVPENTLPAFMTAVALGADEIEFDIRLTKDNRMIVCHDGSVDRVSDGTGNVRELTFEEIRKLNAGHYMGWKNISFPTPEEVFRMLSGKIVFNIHVYEAGNDGFVIDELSALTVKYDMEDMIYFAAQEKEMVFCLEKAPHIDRCMLECFDDNRDVVDIALEYKCSRVQHFYSVYSTEEAKKASDANLVNNLFFEDNPKEVGKRLSEGINVILTNYPDRVRFQ